MRVHEVSLIFVLFLIPFCDGRNKCLYKINTDWARYDSTQFHFNSKSVKSENVGVIKDILVMNTGSGNQQTTFRVNTYNSAWLGFKIELDGSDSDCRGWNRRFFNERNMMVPDLFYGSAVKFSTIKNNYDERKKNLFYTLKKRFIISGNFVCKATPKASSKCSVVETRQVVKIPFTINYYNHVNVCDFKCKGTFVQYQNPSYHYIIKDI